MGFAYFGWAYRTKDASVYHTVERKAGLVRILTSMFTVVGASEFVVFTSLVYVFGWASIGFFVGTLAAFLLLSFLAPKIRENAQLDDQHSIPDFAAKANLPITARGLSIVSVVFTCALVVIQLIIGGLLIHQVTGTNFAITATLLIIGVYVYLFGGGYKALLNTDIVQGVVMFVFTIGFCIYLFLPVAQTPDVQSSALPSPGWFDAILLFFGGFFAILGGPEIWQRITTCVDDRTARRGLVASGILMLVWGGTLILAAVAIRSAMPNANPDDAFLTFLADGGIPGWLLGGMLLLLLAAILSTADTELFAASVITAKEMKRLLRRSGPLEIKGTRIVMACLAAVILVMALFTQNILNVYFALVYLTFITGPLAFTILFSRGGRTLKVRRWSTGIALVAATVIFFWVLAESLFVSWQPLLICGVAAVPALLPGERQMADRKTP